jgi:Signal transduction histidine kinase
MKRNLLDRFGLPLLFSFMIFIVLLITTFFMGAMTFFAFRSGMIDNPKGPGFPVLILIMMLASIIVGMIVSLIQSKFSIRTIRAIKAATSQLAKGDFSARLNFTRPVELREISDSFNLMAEELGSIELLRTDFINNFSHEFKTPIVSLKGFAEILKHNDLSDEEKCEYLDIIISESDRLSSLATNILNLSKLENQNILTEKRQYNLTEQIRRAILMFETKWVQKNITFSIAMDDVRYVGNEELLSQVWLNLLDNAIKFTPIGGDIHISLKQADHSVKFTIHNSGYGISQKTINHIFDKFYKGDISHATEGYGLGLSVVHRIVTLHGGKISCTSEENNWTEFIVEFPFPIHNEGHR